MRSVLFFICSIVLVSAAPQLYGLVRGNSQYFFGTVGISGSQSTFAKFGSAYNGPDIQYSTCSYVDQTTGDFYVYPARSNIWKISPATGKDWVQLPQTYYPFGNTGYNQMFVDGQNNSIIAVVESFDRYRQNHALYFLEINPNTNENQTLWKLAITSNSNSLVSVAWDPERRIAFYALTDGSMNSDFAGVFLDSGLTAYTFSSTYAPDFEFDPIAYTFIGASQFYRSDSRAAITTVNCTTGTYSIRALSVTTKLFPYNSHSFNPLQRTFYFGWSQNFSPQIITVNLDTNAISTYKTYDSSVSSYSLLNWFIGNVTF